MKHFNSLTELHRENGQPLPEMPLLSLMRDNKICTHCDSFLANFYSIAFKKMKSGVVMYGRTKYDHESGSMYFTKPLQVIEGRNVELEEEGFTIWVHEDYLAGNSLHADIQKYSYFNYEINEALHVSPNEEATLWDLYRKIETEYYNNQDEFTKDIILGHISTMLKYAQRLYKRQFINRNPIAGTTVSRFNEVLSAYLEKGLPGEKALPTVAVLAADLGVSPRYLRNR